MPPGSELNITKVGIFHFVTQILGRQNFLYSVMTKLNSKFMSMSEVDFRPTVKLEFCPAVGSSFAVIIFAAGHECTILAAIAI